MRDLTNQKFGKWTVICPTKKRTKGGYVYWLCRCNCGNLVEVISHNLLIRATKSCGCLQKESLANNKRGFKHGDRANGKYPLYYRIWVGMKSRCHNKNHSDYKYYGKRGISVCNEWHSYKNFKTWALTNGYKGGLTIDRIDNDGNYEPNNCQWISKSDNTKKSNVERERRKWNKLRQEAPDYPECLRRMIRQEGMK